MKNNSKHIADIELIAKFFAKELGQEDIKKLNDWIKVDSDNKKLFKQYLKAWDSVGQIQLKKEIDIDLEWTKLNEKINNKDQNKILLTSQKHKPALFKSFLKIAAIFILAVFTAYSTYYIVKNFTYKKVIASIHSKEVTLPDGSEITVNEKSSLQYPKAFSDSIRKVKLKGEAYFKVSHNKEKVFIIEVEGAEIKVLGTQFNVKAYKDDNLIEVSVDTGRVSFRRLNDFKEIILQTGDIGTYSLLTNELKKEVKIDNNISAWKTKKIIFRNTSLKNVAKILSKVYHTNIIVNNEEIKDCKIEASFDNQSLESIIKVITAILPNIDFNKTPKGYIVRGVSCE